MFLKLVNSLSSLWKVQEQQDWLIFKRSKFFLAYGVPDYQRYERCNFCVNVCSILWFRNDKLTNEKMEIEKKLETFQREMKHVSKVNTAKEIRVLKKVVQNLEVGISHISVLQTSSFWGL